MFLFRYFLINGVSRTSSLEVGDFDGRDASHHRNSRLVDPARKSNRKNAPRHTGHGCWRAARSGCGKDEKRDFAGAYHREPARRWSGGKRVCV